MCFFGSVLIVLNEKKSQVLSTSTEKSHFVIGIVLSVIQLIMTGFLVVSQKVLVNDNIPNDIQQFYLSLSTCMCGFIVPIILILISLGVLNCLLYYIANTFQHLAMEKMDVGKFLPVTYVLIIFVFIFGIIFLWEWFISHISLVA